jgi:hypothetical protein
MSVKKLAVTLVAGAIGILILAGVAYHYLAKPRRGDISLGPFGKPVYRAPVPFSDEELRQAQSGKMVNGLQLVLRLDYGNEFIAGTSPGVQVAFVEEKPLVLEGNWIAEVRGALGLPPEKCYLEAWRDGVSFPCPNRPAGPEGYMGGGGASYPLSLADWGDFSKPGKYRIRLLYKNSRPPITDCDWSGVVASNEVEFHVVERK